VLEYANEGNLRDFLKKNFTSLNWKNKIQMALDISCGLKFLHFNEIIHRNLVKVFSFSFVIFVYDNDLIILLFL
jgi:serine/threonine protein kinase